MNRRAFFKSMIGGVAAAAAVRTWPFRVFSFPQEIKVAPPPPKGSWEFEYDGFPIIENPYAPPNTIFLINDKYLTHPGIIEKLISKQSVPISNREMRIPIRLIS